jgi:DNA-binding XRE family transcriptional regulator
MHINGDVVRTSGLCSICDFKFRDEVVARYPEPAMPGGWAYVELRHLKPDEIEELGGITAQRVVPPRPGLITGDAVAHFAANVRRRRKFLKLTQEEAADRADMNMSYWSRIERGVIDPGVRMVVRVATALETTAAELMTSPETVFASAADQSPQVNGGRCDAVGRRP